MPQLAMPQGFRKGRLSYTVVSAATGAKVEVLLKQKAFRITLMGQHEGVSTCSNKNEFQKDFVCNLNLTTRHHKVSKCPNAPHLPIELLTTHFAYLVFPNKEQQLLVAIKTWSSNVFTAHVR